MSELFDHVDGDVSKFVGGSVVYAIGQKLGLRRDETYRYSVALGKRGLLITSTFKPEQIGSVRLTIDGADFVILMP
jgi:hypothetical protein